MHVASKCWHKTEREVTQILYNTAVYMQLGKYTQVLSSIRIGVVIIVIHRYKKLDIPLQNPIRNHNLCSLYLNMKLITSWNCNFCILEKNNSITFKHDEEQIQLLKDEWMGKILLLCFSTTNTASRGY